jgi:hypothetical protein
MCRYEIRIGRRVQSPSLLWIAKQYLRMQVQFDPKPERPDSPGEGNWEQFKVRG